MPGAVLIKELVQTYQLFQAGKMSEARQLFNRVVPLINFRAQFSLPVTKEVLRRQGVFATTHIRRPTGPLLDEQDLVELSVIMESIGL
jgi:4-hydroxy-tetrahydrodipicolinate synthase